MHSKLMIQSLFCGAAIIVVAMAAAPASPPNYRYKCVSDDSVCDKANATRWNSCCYFNQTLSYYIISSVGRQCWCNEGAPPKETPTVSYTCTTDVPECNNKVMANRWRYWHCCYGNDEIVKFEGDPFANELPSCTCNPR